MLRMMQRTNKNLKKNLTKQSQQHTPVTSNKDILKKMLRMMQRTNKNLKKNFNQSTTYTVRPPLKSSDLSHLQSNQRRWSARLPPPTSQMKSSDMSRTRISNRSSAFIFFVDRFSDRSLWWSSHLRLLDHRLLPPPIASCHRPRPSDVTSCRRRPPPVASCCEYRVWMLSLRMKSLDAALRIKNNELRLLVFENNNKLRLRLCCCSE
nr:hypothetical protein Iba_scaffold5809CG0120 [Ipomoea batatas]